MMMLWMNTSLARRIRLATFLSNAWAGITSVSSWIRSVFSSEKSRWNVPSLYG